MGFWGTGIGQHISGMLNPGISSQDKEEQNEAACRNSSSAIAAAHPLDNFNGVWKFDRERSDSPEEQLKALRVPWWKRVAARQANPTMTIEHPSLDPDSSAATRDSAAVWNEHIVFPFLGPFYELQEQLPLDGSPQHSTLHGFSVEKSTSVDCDGTEVVTRTIVDDAHRGVIRRHLIDDGQTYHVESILRLSNGEVVVKNSFFNRT